ncbi:MAG: GNAT family N-acetyltransferase [Chloroflexaceae bacterium]|nr:GNAT family N-acetyltransferase [Chloroflexaceae bacterium]
MSTITVQQLAGDEHLDILAEFAGYAFGPSPPLPDSHIVKRHATWYDESMVLAAYRDDEPLAIAVATPMTQHVRGLIVPMAGIRMVTTHPAARRQGLVRILLTRLFSMMRDRGIVVSTLYPFRESFYERFGYVRFPKPRIVTFSPVPLQPLLHLNLEGQVSRMPIREGFAYYWDCLQRQQQQTHGMALTSEKAALAIKDTNDVWLAWARVADTPVGAMIYRIVGTTEQHRMIVQRFHALDIRGRYLLLEWFARHIDQINEIEVQLPAFERPETWTADLDIRLSTCLGPMGRVIDIARLNGIACGPGQFTAQIRDEYCPWNEGSYAFECIDGRLHIQRVQQAACILTIQAISSLIYGTHEPAMFAMRGWGCPDAALQSTMTSMFPLMQPYLHESF